MNNTLLRDSLAELLGTFTLVFLGGLAGSVAGHQTGSVLPALAHGLTLIGIIYAYGHWSGAHVNPAVTAGLLVGRKITIQRAAYYWVAQIIGAVVAAVVINAVVPNGAVAAQTTGSLTAANIASAALLEFILTFVLVTTVYQAAVYQKVGHLAGVAIGFTLAGCIVAGGAFSGASLNPARTLGPALIAGDFSYVPAYLLAIFAGGIAAGLLHAYVLRPAAGEPAPASAPSQPVRGPGKRR